jgi:membrane fusion protein (multidrug efflux system)
MASKALYTVVAVVGIAAASGAAWWYQNKPAKPGAKPAGWRCAGGAAPRGRGSGPGAGGGTGPGARGRGGCAGAKPWPDDDAQAVGSLRSRQSVVLRPEVSGAHHAAELPRWRPRAQGPAAGAAGRPAAAGPGAAGQAELSIAQANHKRNQELVAQNFISQRSVDESAANLQVAQAKLSLAQATAARLRIVAPFDGMAGIRGVNVGDYLKDGADIVNIEDMRRDVVDFPPARAVPDQGASVARCASVDVDALPGRKFTAVVQAIDPLVDANGRSVGVRACIDNREGCSCAPACSRGSRGVWRARRCARHPRGSHRAAGRAPDVYQAGRRPGQGQQDGPARGGQGRHAPPGKVEILRGLQPGRHGGDRRPAARAGRRRLAVRVVRPAARQVGRQCGSAPGPQGRRARRPCSGARQPGGTPRRARRRRCQAVPALRAPRFGPIAGANPAPCARRPDAAPTRRTGPCNSLKSPSAARCLPPCCRCWCC